MSIDIRNKKVHLALGCGGARGVAHIGVIQRLEEMNCEILSVSGSSMGAVIGGIYCTGKLPLFAKWLSKLTKRDVFSLIDFTFSTSGLIKGRRILEEIASLIGDYRIEDLPIPFTAVATDLFNGEEVRYTQGNLYKAIRASIGIPSFFTPMVDHNRLLIDGGILNPLPVSVLQKKSEDEVIVAVNLCDKKTTKPFLPKKTEPNSVTNELMHKLEAYLPQWKKAEEKDTSEPEPELAVPNMIDILLETIDLMQDQVIEQTVKQYQPDVVINIRRDFAQTMDFHLTSRLIAEGIRAFDEAVL